MVLTFAKTRGLFYQILMVAAALLPGKALAGFSLDLSGSGSNSSAGLVAQQDNAVTASVGMDLGEHFQLGLSHRISDKTQKGLREVTLMNGTRAYTKFESDTRATINSLNLAIILYNGVLSPYVFGGAARHQYYLRINVDGEVSEDKQVIPLLPNYGVGVAIYLNQNFSLKISQTFSPGIKVVLDDKGEEKAEVSRDSYLEVGIRYRL